MILHSGGINITTTFRMGLMDPFLLPETGKVEFVDAGILFRGKPVRYEDFFDQVSWLTKFLKACFLFEK
ncbi:MAG: hypothetical protein WKF89_13120 [Chitinophagaceae bacterium]